MIRTQAFGMSSKLALTGAVLALSAMAVQAQMTPPPTEPAAPVEPAAAVEQAVQPTAAGMNPADLFTKADANADGKLSRDEAQAVPGLGGKFDAVDADKDGSLSQTEFGAALADK